MKADIPHWGDYLIKLVGLNLDWLAFSVTSIFSSHVLKLMELLVPLTWAGLQLWSKCEKNSVNCEEQMFWKLPFWIHREKTWKRRNKPKPSLSLFIFSSPFSKLLGSLRHTFPTHLPTSYSFLINMQCAHWYSNCVLCYDLINGIWLLAWILEMGLVFGTLKMAEAGGAKGGPWEGKNPGEQRHRPAN